MKDNDWRRDEDLINAVQNDKDMKKVYIEDTRIRRNTLSENSAHISWYPQAKYSINKNKGIICQ